MKNLFLHSLSAAAMAAALALTAPAAAVPIQINYLDESGKGFNDAQLGQQRRAAFEATMFVLSNSFKGSIPIVVDTYFEYGLGASWGYGDGWPTIFVRDYAGLKPGTYYPVALGNQLLNTVLSPETSDITIIFNGDLVVTGGQFGEKYYYGWDGYAGNDVDFITEAAHGFMRGAGMYTLVDAKTGEYIVLTGDTAGYPDIMSTFLAFVWENIRIDLTSVPANVRVLGLTCDWYLRWTGDALRQVTGIYVPMYAPYVAPSAPAPYGVADHFHPSVSSDQLMSPWYVGPIHDLGGAKYTLMDLGWEFFY